MFEKADKATTLSICINVQENAGTEKSNSFQENILQRCSVKPVDIVFYYSITLKTNINE